MDSQVIVRADGQKWLFQVKGWTVWKLGAFIATALDGEKTYFQSLQYVIENLIQGAFPCVLTPLDAKGKPEDMREQDIAANGTRLLDMDGDDIAKVIYAFLASKLASAIFLLVNTQDERVKKWRRSLQQMAASLEGKDIEALLAETPETSDSAGEDSSEA